MASTSKIIKFLLLVLLSLILLAVIFRNQIFKFCLEDYAAKALNAEFKIKNAKLWFGCASIEGVTLKAKDFFLVGESAVVRFKVNKKKPFLYLSGIDLSGMVLKIKLPDKVKPTFEKKSAYLFLPISAEPIRLKLKNINIALENKSLKVNTNFSLNAEFSPERVFVNDADILDFDIRSPDFEIDNLSLKKFRKNRYLLKIFGTRIKDKKFSGFSVPVSTGVNLLLFPRAKNPFFGQNGYTSAKLELTGTGNFCFSAKFYDASFEKIVEIFAPEEAAVKGLFDGALKACAASLKISSLQADFKNKGNGLINLKKESSFEFLKNYLDTPSYNALIDNFKNYEYNIGAIGLRKEANSLSLNLDFSSEAMGRRNITINLHSILEE